VTVVDLMQQFFGDYFWAVVGLIVLALVLTAFVFRRRLFERGYRKGLPAHPGKIRRQNKPDEWSRSH
jgi:hypothetical protein